MCADSPPTGAGALGENDAESQKGERKHTSLFSTHMDSYRHAKYV